MAPFITTDQLGDYASHTDAEFAITAACDIVRGQTGQTLDLVEDDTVLLDGTGTDALVLPEHPVVSVAEVIVNDEPVDTDDYALSDNGVLVRIDRGYWFRGRQNIEVTYTHGYADGHVPSDLQLVARSIATRILSTEGQAIRQETIGAYSVTYTNEVATNDLTVGERAILRKHRRT